MVKVLLVKETEGAPFSEPVSIKDPYVQTAWHPLTNIVTMKLH